MTEHAAPSPSYPDRKTGTLHVLTATSPANKDTGAFNNRIWSVLFKIKLLSLKKMAKQGVTEQPLNFLGNVANVELTSLSCLLLPRSCPVKIRNAPAAPKRLSERTGREKI